MWVYPALRSSGDRNNLILLLFCCTRFLHGETKQNEHIFETITIAIYMSQPMC